MGVNTLSKYGDIMRKPVGRVHWACSELAMDWCGYFEGAVESGQRVADEVRGLLAPRSRL
jgi:monoamine oxidase